MNTFSLKLDIRTEFISVSRYCISANYIKKGNKRIKVCTTTNYKVLCVV